MKRVAITRVDPKERARIRENFAVRDVDSGNQWKKLFKRTTGKDFTSHPAMKLGRLGVSNTFKGSGIGTIILDYIKELSITNNGLMTLL